MLIFFEKDLSSFLFLNFPSPEALDPSTPPGWLCEGCLKKEKIIIIFLFPEAPFGTNGVKVKWS